MTERRKIKRAERVLSPARRVAARRNTGKTYEDFDLAVPDPLASGHHYRWLYGLRMDEVLALRECLNEVLA